MYMRGVHLYEIIFTLDMYVLFDNMHERKRKNNYMVAHIYNTKMMRKCCPFITNVE